MKKIKTNEKKGNDTKEYFSLESKDNCKFDVNLINEEIDTETLPILVEMEKKIPDHEYTLERHDKSVSKLKSESEIHNIKKKLFKVIPLGGLEQIGMNMTVFEYQDRYLIVDCGILFPDKAERMLTEEELARLRGDDEEDEEYEDDIDDIGTEAEGDPAE